MLKTYVQAKFSGLHNIIISLRCLYIIWPESPTQCNDRLKV
jgi:hypothetical protein